MKFYFYLKQLFRLRNLKAIFVIGVPVIVNGSQMEVDNDAQIKLELENALHGDILQVTWLEKYLKSSLFGFLKYLSSANLG
jgi:hypothetical protein